MFSQPKILVCTDFSVYSDWALEAATHLARKTNGSVSLLHISDLSFYMNLGEELPKIDERMLEQIKEKLRLRLHDQAISCAANPEVIVRIEANVIEGILGAIHELKPEVVFVGARGTSQVSRFLFGSTVRKLASSSPVPLMVIKEPKLPVKIAGLVDPDFEMAEIVNASEELSFLLGSSNTVLSLIHHFPGLFGRVKEYSHLVVEMLKKDSELKAQQLTESLRSQVAATTRVVVEQSHEGQLALHLGELLQEEKIDLAVVKKHHKTAVDRFILGSITEKLLGSFSGNLLIL